MSKGWYSGGGGDENDIMIDECRQEGPSEEFVLSTLATLILSLGRDTTSGTRELFKKKTGTRKDIQLAELRTEQIYNEATQGKTV